MSASPYFLAAFALVVGEEGGYVADPADPGGATKYGISQRAYPALDIANLTLADAQALYLRDYWTAAGCEALGWESALCLFDCAVNQGLGAARELYAAHGANMVAFMTARDLRYKEDAEFPRFGLGWITRLFTIFKAAQETPS